MSDRIEIRFNGRGGQGIVTAAQLLANAYIRSGYYAQAMPHFGAERRGAPVEAYLRIDRRPINVRSPIKNPDILVFIDPTVATREKISELKPNGILILNCNKTPEEIRRIYAVPETIKVVTVDATKIALDVLKANYFNTPTLGAVIKVLNLDLSTIENVVISTFGENVGRLNVEAIKRAYEEARIQ